MKPPCTRECPLREVGCHGKCEAWQTYEAWRNENYKKRHEEVVNNNSVQAERNYRKALLMRWKYGRNDRKGKAI